MGTYAQVATLINSSDFQDRVKIAVAFFAQYILNEGTGVTNHERRAAWARSAFLNPGGSSAGLLTSVALDNTIRTNLASSTDAQIQTATEYVVSLILNF